jgi:hypothetical protein
MSYIGNTPITSSFLTDTFSGNGSTTAFTMTIAPASTTSLLVIITGVVQDPSTYTISGTTLTFSTAPPTGTSNISARYLGIQPIVNPLNYRFPFYTYAGVSSPITLPNNQYLPFYTYTGASSNISLVSS